MAKIGRPTEKPAINQFRIRLTDDELKMLNECSKALGINKSDVIRKGIEKLHSENFPKEQK